jgi:hypothetical protein
MTVRPTRVNMRQGARTLGGRVWIVYCGAERWERRRETGKRESGNRREALRMEGAARQFSTVPWSRVLGAEGLDRLALGGAKAPVPSGLALKTWNSRPPASLCLKLRGTAKCLSDFTRLVRLLL